MSTLKAKIIEQLLALVARVSLGKDLAGALGVLRLIARAVEKKDAEEISVYVFRQLPTEWKHPEGPASEKEFVAMIKAGEEFIRRCLALTSKG